jgi:hypothetical protein
VNRREASRFSGALVSDLAARPQRTPGQMTRGDAAERRLQVDLQAVDAALSVWVASRRCGGRLAADADDGPTREEFAMDELGAAPRDRLIGIEEPLVQVLAVGSRSRLVAR